MSGKSLAQPPGGFNPDFKKGAAWCPYCGKPQAFVWDAYTRYARCPGCGISTDDALGLAARWVRRNMRDIRRLIAYADPARGHKGTIYRAAPPGRRGRSKVKVRADFRLNAQNLRVYAVRRAGPVGRSGVTTSGGLHGGSVRSAGRSVRPSASESRGAPGAGSGQGKGPLEAEVAVLDVAERKGHHARRVPGRVGGRLSDSVGQGRGREEAPADPAGEGPRGLPGARRWVVRGGRGVGGWAEPGPYCLQDGLVRPRSTRMDLN